jgi:glycosyltransferase involved in cell wall biosynthesis
MIREPHAALDDASRVPGQPLHPNRARSLWLVGPGPGTRGGIAQFNAQLARVLRTAGTDVMVISYRRTYPSFSRAGRQGPDPSVSQSDLSFEPLLVPWLPWTWLAATRRMRRGWPDTVVVQWWHPITAPCIWYITRRARTLGARVVFVCHNAFPHERFPFARTLTHNALRGATSLIALSDTVAAELRDLLPGRDVAVIPHPAYEALASDPETIDDRIAVWRDRISAPPKSKIVLFFGNIRPYKGLSDLVDSFAKIVPNIPAVLVVAGTFFESLDSYRQRIAELQLVDSIRLYPDYIPNEEVAALFAVSDLVVLPYRSASQSGVIPLAAMFEKPVVATAVGGIPAALEGTGALVPPSDPEALAAAIVRALLDPPAPPPRSSEIWNVWRDKVLA